MNYFQGKPSDINKLNNWFSHCVTNGIPYVYVTHRKKYSKVNWDYMSLPTSIDEKLDDSTKEYIVNKIMSTFSNYKNSKSIYNINAIVGDLDNLWPDDACKAADEIYLFLYDTFCA